MALAKLFSLNVTAFTMTREDFTTLCAGILSKFQQVFPSGWHQISFVYHGKLGLCRAPPPQNGCVCMCVCVYACTWKGLWCSSTVRLLSSILNVNASIYVRLSLSYVSCECVFVWVHGCRCIWRWRKCEFVIFNSLITQLPVLWMYRHWDGFLIGSGR